MMQDKRAPNLIALMMDLGPPSGLRPSDGRDLRPETLEREAIALLARTHGRPGPFSPEEVRQARRELIRRAAAMEIAQTEPRSTDAEPLMPLRLAAAGANVRADAGETFVVLDRPVWVNGRPHRLIHEPAAGQLFLSAEGTSFSMIELFGETYELRRDEEQDAYLIVGFSEGDAGELVYTYCQDGVSAIAD